MLRFRDFDLESLCGGRIVCGAGVGTTGGVGIGGNGCSGKPSSVESPLPRFFPCLRHGCNGVDRTRTSVANLNGTEKGVSSVKALVVRKQKL